MTYPCHQHSCRELSGVHLSGVEPQVLSPRYVVMTKAKDEAKICVMLLTMMRGSKWLVVILIPTEHLYISWMSFTPLSRVDPSLER